MADASVLISLDYAPGVQRDGTIFDSNSCIDSQWCRWRLGRPRKIGGYSQITNTLKSTPRRIHMFYDGFQVYVHVGTTTGIQQFILDVSGKLLNSADRTPADFVPNPANGWTIDAIFDTTSSAVQLVAHYVPDTGFLSIPTTTVPLIGILTASTPLVPFSDPTPSSGTWTQPKISGGIVCVQPYVFDFDTAGLVQWSAPNLPLYLGVTGGTTGAGQARISAQKIVQGMPIRGGGTQQPAVIFWTISEVITGVFIGGTPVFAFSTSSPSSSILSSDSVVEYDGLYFWPGIDRFLVFNGTVNEVPNKQNQDWFFDNMNWPYSAKSFAFKVPRYGEIWFCAPLFGNTECSHAAIFNVRENYWYDTELPNGGRGCGFTAQGIPFPIMGGVEPDGTHGYKLWLHESGVDEVVGAQLTAIRSFFEGPWLGAPKGQQPNNEGSSIQMLEPDFTQSGDLSVTIIGAPNSRAPLQTGPTVPIKLVATTPQEQFPSFKQSSRLFRVRVESNELGGTYIAGKNILHTIPAKDARLFS